MPTLPHNADARPRSSAVRSGWLLGSLAAAAAFRAHALYRFGPQNQPDSENYLDFARAILSGPDWFLSGSVESVTAFRMVGYPAVIASATLVAGERFDIAVVSLQSMLSLIAMIQLYQLGRAFGISDWAAAFTALAYGCGVVAVFDLNMLTDSLFASLAVILICQLALGILRCRLDRAMPIVLCGVLMAALILLRGATAFASPLFALGAFAWGHAAERSWRRGLRASALFLLPVSIVVGLYLGWNHHRTGHRFLTTESQHALLMAPVALEQQGDAVLREPIMRQAYAATAPLADGPFFVRVFEMGLWLEREAGVDAIARSRLATNAYLTAWREYPLAMMHRVLQEYRGDQFLLLTNFAHAERELKGLAGLQDNPGYRVFLADLIANPTAGNLLVLAMELFCVGLSAVIFASFTAGGVAANWRLFRGDREPGTMVLAWFVVLYCGFVGMYVMVHLEARYTIAMQATALIGGIVVIQRAVMRRMRPPPAPLGS